jgi:hypothetical protein
MKAVAVAQNTRRQRNDWTKRDDGRGCITPPPSHMDMTDEVESPARWHHGYSAGASWFDWQQGVRGRNASFSKPSKVSMAAVEQ